MLIVASTQERSHSLAIDAAEASPTLATASSIWLQRSVSGQAGISDLLLRVGSVPHVIVGYLNHVSKPTDMLVSMKQVKVWPALCVRTTIRDKRPMS